MRIVARENRSDRFSDDIIFYLSSLSSAEDFGSLFDLLIRDGYLLESFSINYEYDHADYKPPLSLSNYEDVLRVLKNNSMDDLSNVIVLMKYRDIDVYGTATPKSDTFRISFPKKKNITNSR